METYRACRATGGHFHFKQNSFKCFLAIPVVSDINVFFSDENFKNPDSWFCQNFVKKGSNYDFIIFPPLEIMGD